MTLRGVLHSRTVLLLGVAVPGWAKAPAPEEADVVVYGGTAGGVAAAVKRELAFVPYADMIWLETKLPDLAQAREFARQIRAKYPGKWFVYNLSPSFNWSGQGFSSAYHTPFFLLGFL